MSAFSRPCPICGTKQPELLADLEFGNFDGGLLSPRVVLGCCQDCGMVYNDVPGGPESLDAFYSEQAIYNAQAGVGSGGGGPLERERYRDTFIRLKKHLPQTYQPLADIGCAKGGFLSYLTEQGFSGLWGVDPNSSCLQQVSGIGGVQTRQGSAQKTPFEANQLRTLLLIHVLEHLYDPMAALQEAKRVLAPDGLLYLETPNAALYQSYPVSDYYWLSQREHINHFDRQLLVDLLQLAGFEVLQAGENLMSLSAEQPHPSLYLAACPTGAGGATPRRRDGMRQIMANYLEAQAEGLRPKRRLCRHLAESGRPLYVWGMGLEFFTLYTLGGLNQCRINGLWDKSPFKQQFCVDGRSISPPDGLGRIESDAVVVISSALHKDSMRNELREVGFEGEVQVLA